MKIGLFFGSFNPVHLGHLIIGSYMADFTDIEQVWFVVSPQNPLKPKKELLNEYERLEMVRLATEDEAKLKASDIEFSLSRPSYTINTLLHLEEKYPGNSWVLLMGSDTYESLPKWKNYEKLIADYEIYIYPRPEKQLDARNLPAHVKLIENVPLMEISASFIRQLVKEKKIYRYYLPEKVFRLIDKWGMYL